MGSDPVDPGRGGPEAAHASGGMLGRAIAALGLLFFLVPFGAAVILALTGSVIPAWRPILGVVIAVGVLGFCIVGVGLAIQHRGRFRSTNSRPPSSRDDMAEEWADIVAARDRRAAEAAMASGETMESSSTARCEHCGVAGPVSEPICDRCGAPRRTPPS